MKRTRRSSYPMPVEDLDELARELSEFGYRETCDPDEANRRNYYKVEHWDASELHVDALLHASNDLTRARALFATEKKRRPRGRYTLRQGIRVLERWPPNKVRRPVARIPYRPPSTLIGDRNGIDATRMLRCAGQRVYVGVAPA